MSTKPSSQRASHPNTTDPRWITGKAVFADLISGKSSIGLIGLEDFKDALFYSRTVLFPKAGGNRVKVALRNEAKKRSVL